MELLYALKDSLIILTYLRLTWEYMKLETFLFNAKYVKILLNIMTTIRNYIFISFRAHILRDFVPFFNNHGNSLKWWWRQIVPIQIQSISLGSVTVIRMYVGGKPIQNTTICLTLLLQKKMIKVHVGCVLIHL